MVKIKFGSLVNCFTFTSTKKRNKMSLPIAKKLNNAVNDLKELADQAREKMEEKRAWWDERSEKWQESDKGQEWDQHLENLESLIDSISDLEELDLEVD